MASKASLAFSNALRESMDRKREEARRAALDKIHRKEEEQEKQDDQHVDASDHEDCLDDPQDFFMSVAARRKENGAPAPSTEDKQAAAPSTPQSIRKSKQNSGNRNNQSPAKYTLASPLKSKAERRERLSKLTAGSPTRNGRTKENRLLSDDALHIINSDLENTATDLEIERDCKWRQFWKPASEQDTNSHHDSVNPSSFLLYSNSHNSPFLTLLYNLLLDAYNKDPLCFPISLVSPYSRKLSAIDRRNAILLLFSAVVYPKASTYLSNRIMSSLMSLIGQNPRSFSHSSSSSTVQDDLSSIVPAHVVRNCFLTLGALERCVLYNGGKEQHKTTRTPTTTEKRTMRTEDEEHYKGKGTEKAKHENQEQYEFIVPDLSIGEEERRPILFRLLRIVEELASQNAFLFNDALQIVLMLVRLDLDLCSNVIHMPIQRALGSLVNCIKSISQDDKDLALKRRTIVVEITKLADGTSAYLKNQITKSFLPFKSKHHSIIIRWIAVSMATCDLTDLSDEYFLYPPSLKLLSERIRSAQNNALQLPLLPAEITTTKSKQQQKEEERPNPFFIADGNVDDVSLYYTVDTIAIALAGITDDISDADKLYPSTSNADVGNDEDYLMDCQEQQQIKNEEEGDPEKQHEEHGKEVDCRKQKDAEKIDREIKREVEEDKEIIQGQQQQQQQQQSIQRQRRSQKSSEQSVRCKPQQRPLYQLLQQSPSNTHLQQHAKNDAILNDSDNENLTFKNPHRAFASLSPPPLRPKLQHKDDIVVLNNTTNSSRRNTTLSKTSTFASEKKQKKNNEDIIIINSSSDSSSNGDTKYSTNYNNVKGNSNSNKRKEIRDQKAFMLSYFSPLSTSSLSSPLSSPLKKRKTTNNDVSPTMDTVSESRYHIPGPSSSVDIIISSSSSEGEHHDLGQNLFHEDRTRDRSASVIVLNGSETDTSFIPPQQTATTPNDVPTNDYDTKITSTSVYKPANKEITDLTITETPNAATKPMSSPLPSLPSLSLQTTSPSKARPAIQMSGRQIRESMTELIKVLKTLDNRLKMDIKTGNPERNVTKNAILRLWHGLDYQLRAAGWQVDLSGNGRQQVLSFLMNK